PERGAAFLGRFHTDLTTMRLYDRTNDREAQSRSLSLCCHERLEHTVTQGGWNSRPRITDDDRDLSHAVGPRADHDVTRGTRQIADGIDRVEEQIEKYLLELHAIALHPRDHRIEIQRQRNLSDHQITADEPRHIGYDIVDGERLEHGIVAPDHRART